MKLDKTSGRRPGTSLVSRPSGIATAATQKQGNADCFNIVPQRKCATQREAPKKKAGRLRPAGLRRVRATSTRSRVGWFSGVVRNAEFQRNARPRSGPRATGGDH
ncbi:hypothetical protein SORBI_3007G181801 [Sorghum bicolor]|uniref:Uncharacterized protein n=1 Tax=Sorghum bicolor TaxID=4558 RepID=A0A1Z5RAI7_SORBI|nr:hypothetical protein SORBI_3007G181801 [Sorghum bicolor]